MMTGPSAPCFVASGAIRGQIAPREVIRQDYILREIERTIQFCIRLLGLKEDMEAWKLEQFLEDNCEALTGLRYEALVHASSGELVTLLHHPGTPSFGRLVACGCVLCEAADVARLRNDMDEARALFMRGIEVLAFTSAQEDREVQALIAGHLDRLQERIDSFDFSTGELRKLAALFAASRPGPR